MISNDFTIELASWAMSQRMSEAHIAAENIVRSNSVGAVRSTGNFQEILSALINSARLEDVNGVRNAMASSVEISATSGESIAIDQEVADMTSAQGGYSALANAVSLKLGLMSIAANGGR